MSDASSRPSPIDGPPISSHAASDPDQEADDDQDRDRPHGASGAGMGDQPQPCDELYHERDDKADEEGRITRLTRPRPGFTNERNPRGRREHEAADRHHQRGPTDFVP